MMHGRQSANGIGTRIEGPRANELAWPTQKPERDVSAVVSERFSAACGLGVLWYELQIPAATTTPPFRTGAKQGTPPQVPA